MTELDIIDGHLIVTRLKTEQVLDLDENVV